jgi:Na+:H+ antiporter, NhaA family
MSRSSSRLLEFLRTEEGSGFLLLAAAAIALIWANSPLSDVYHRLWETEVGALDLQHWVNDGLMTSFFFVVGLEIKREVTSGELRDPRKLALPAIAAVGGMVVPAGIYLLLNAGGPSASGFGVPVATDIAFALGVLTLAASRAPVSVRSFLLTLAIVDDIGAVLLIAVFYSGGVHPTVLGVVLGLLIPTALADRIESILHPWTSRFVVPIFALANAGVTIDGSAIGATISPVGLGVFLGLVVGKPLGIGAAVWAATRTGVARLPSDVTPRLLAGAAVLAGIGFTVALFVAELAFADPETAKLAILAASAVASVLGVLILRREGRREL